MTITVWLKREIVLNWAHYEKNLDEIFQISTREPNDLDMVQVNISFEQYRSMFMCKELIK